MHFSRYRTCALTAGAVAALYASVAQAGIEVHHQGNVSYISGGIGRDESDELEAMQRDYNLRITSADKYGHFFGDTHIMVSDFSHHNIIDTTGGPLFYINLPNGRYVVEGSTGLQSKKQVITIAGGKTVSIHFSWQQNFADTTND